MNMQYELVFQIYQPISAIRYEKYSSNTIPISNIYNHDHEILKEVLLDSPLESLKVKITLGLDKDEDLTFLVRSLKTYQQLERK